MRASTKAVLGTTVIVLVVAAVIAGLLLLGPPIEERERKLDAIRVADLRAIAEAIDRYWTTNSGLPPSLEALAKERDTSLRLLDPETGQPYEYRVVAGAVYELCANFAREGFQDQRTIRSPAAAGEPYPVFWSHETGRHCYSIEPRQQH